MIDIGLNTGIVTAVYDTTVTLAVWAKNHAIPMVTGGLIGWMLYSARAAQWRVKK